MTKTKILIITAFMFAFSVNAFAAIPVVTGDEPEAPKVVIKEGDRMTKESGFMGIKNLKLYILLHEASGIKDLMKKFMIAYNSNDINELDRFNAYTIRRFNDFLSKSQANRDKIADVINTKLRQKWEEKREKKRIEKEEERQTLERARNSKLLFLHFFGSFNFADTRGTGHFDFTMMPGLRFSYYFLNPLSKLNIGIAVQFSYLMFGKKYAEAEYFETGILCSMKLKFSSVSNIVLNIGFSLLNRTGYKIETFEIKEFYKTVPAFALEIGYLFISKNQKFTFFFNFSTLYAKLYKEVYDGTWYGGTISSQNKPGLMYGVSMGIGFNLL